MHILVGKGCIQIILMIFRTNYPNDPPASNLFTTLKPDNLMENIVFTYILTL